MKLCYRIKTELEQQYGWYDDDDDDDET